MNKFRLDGDYVLEKPGSADIIRGQYPQAEKLEMKKFPAFEASLLGMLVDKCRVGRRGLSRLLKLKRLDGRTLVQRAVEMKLVDEGRLARLISQHWELPLVDIAFPYRRFLVHFSRPIDDLLVQDLLPLEITPGEVTAVSYYIPSAETTEALEGSRGVKLRLYISTLRPVKEALLRLREEVKRFQASQPVDCGTDKELFYGVTAEGWPAVVRERFAGGAILIEFEKSRRLTKTVESLDPSEPPAVKALLLGKSMSAVAAPGEDIRRLVGDFVETVGLFEGELCDAILKLRVAQMMFDSEDAS